MADRRLAGAEAKAGGALFERAVADACAAYAAGGAARIEKTPEPFRVTRMAGGRASGYFEKKAQPDYKGVLRGGRCAVMEAKSSGREWISQGAVTDAQAAALDAYSELGAYCCVLVSLGGGFYRVPWDAWRGAAERLGRKRMRTGDLAPFRVPEECGMPMFLSPTAEWYAGHDGLGGAATPSWEPWPPPGREARQGRGDG